MLHKVYIIEKLPDPVPTFEGLVISLAPEVSYQLSKIGVAYSIPEDFLSMQELYSKMPAYIKLLDEWLDGIDESLLQHFKKLKLLNVKPARLYGYWLGWIVGSYVTNSLFIRTILEKTKSSKVIYFRPKKRSEPTGIEIWHEKETIFSILIPIICKNKDIELQEVLVGQEIIVENFTVKKESKFKAKILNLPYIYYLYKMYKLKKYLPYNILNVILKKHTILSLAYSGWGIDKILHSAIRAGYHVRYISNESFNEPAGHDNNLINEIDLNAALFNDFVGFDLSDVLKEKVKYFINDIVPNLEIAIPKYQELFVRKRISVVLGYNKSTFAEHAIIAAAVASKSTLAVLFTHGYSALDVRCSNSLSEEPCDLYLTFDEGLKEYLSASSFKNREVVVEKSPLWVKKYISIRGSRGERKMLTPREKPLVLYIPSVFHSELQRLDAFFYPRCWYFEHQKKLLQYFMREKDFHFIWKAYPADVGIINPIQKMIKDNGYDNIEFSSGNLIDYIMRADYAVMDYPSSYMYETCVSGIPTLSLYHESFRIRDTAKAEFGDILAQFSTTEESIDKISEFLRSNPDRFIVNIDVPEDKGFEVIDRHMKHKCHAG